MIQWPPVEHSNDRAHKRLIVNAIHWVLQWFNGLQDSTNGQVLVSDGNGSLSFDHASNTNKPYALKTGNYTLTDSDWLIECTGSWTLTLHTPTNQRDFVINNSGNGYITFSGTVQDDSSFILGPGEGLHIYWTGTEYLAA